MEGRSELHSYRSGGAWQALELAGSDYWINTVRESDDWMFQWDDGQLQQTKGSNKVSVAIQPTVYRINQIKPL